MRVYTTQDDKKLSLEIGRIAEMLYQLGVSFSLTDQGEIRGNASYYDIMNIMTTMSFGYHVTSWKFNIVEIPDGHDWNTIDEVYSFVFKPSLSLERGVVDVE